MLPAPVQGNGLRDCTPLELSYSFVVVLQHLGGLRILRTPIDAWMNLHAVALLMAIAVTVAIESSIVIVITTCGSFYYFLARCSPERTKGSGIKQIGNWLTGVRLILILMVIILMHEFSPFLIFALFATNVLLDVADGFAARKMGQASYFGAVFDQEVDAVFVICAGLFFYFVSGFALWVLIPGILRCVFRITVWMCKAAEFEEKRRPLLASLAGLNFLLLTVAVILPPGAQFGILVLSTGLFIVSFSVSFREILRTSDDHPLSQ